MKLSLFAACSDEPTFSRPFRPNLPSTFPRRGVARQDCRGPVRPSARERSSRALFVVDHLTEANQVGFVTSTRTCPLVLIDDPGVVQAATITAEPVASPVDKPPPASTLTMAGSVELHVQVALTGLPR
jgi:hypothetical protein